MRNYKKVKPENRKKGEYGEYKREKERAWNKVQKKKEWLMKIVKIECEKFAKYAHDNEL